MVEQVNGKCNNCGHNSHCGTSLIKEVDKDAILQYYKDTGEILPGVDIIYKPFLTLR